MTINRKLSGVCQILHGDDPESAEPFASGILIDPGWVLTAAHVVIAGEDRLWVRLDEGESPRAVSSQLRHTQHLSKSSPIKFDIAALQLATPAGEHGVLPLLDDAIWYLTRYQNRHLGDSLTCYGWPDADGIGCSAQIKLKQRIQRVSAPALDAMQLDAGIPDGYSGGPVVVFLKDGTPACLGMAVQGGLLEKTTAHSSVVLGPKRLCAWLNDVTQDKPAIPHRLLSPKNRHYFSIAPWAQPQDPIAQLKAGEVADLLTWSQALTELVGRDDLLAKFDDWADTAAAGRLHCRVLHGEGGLGKTRFAMDWLERMSQKGWQAFYINGSSALPDLTVGLFDKDPWLLVWDYPETALANQRLVETLAHWAGGSAPRVLLLLSRHNQNYWEPIFAGLTLNSSLFRCDYQAMPLLEAKHSYAVLTETLRATGANPSRVEWDSYKSWMDGADTQGNANHELRARRQYLRYPLLTIGQGLCLALNPQLSFAQLTHQNVIDKLVERERKRLKHLEQRLSLRPYQAGIAERLQLLAIWLGELSYECLQALAEDSRIQYLGLPAGEELEAFLDERGLGILKNNALQPLAPDVLAAGFAFRVLNGLTNQQSGALPHWLARILEKTSVAGALKRLGQRHHDWTFGLRQKLGDDDRFWQVWQAVFAQYPELAQRACREYFSSYRGLLPQLGSLAWQQEVARLKPLSQQDFAAHGPDLAMSLNHLSLRLAESGDKKSGLVAIQEATTIYRSLAETNFAAYGPDLAGSLNNLSNRLAASGDNKGGLKAIQEATNIYRTLAEADFSTWAEELAMSVHNLSNRLAATGERAEGLKAIQEAVTIRRTLAEANFAAYGPDLARSLNNLSNLLAESGDRKGGLKAIQEAVTIRRALAEANFAAYGRDLAGSLHNLSIRLAETENPDGALKASQEATNIYRALAETNFAAYGPVLALSLNNLSKRFADLNDDEKGVETLEEAQSVYKQCWSNKALSFLDVQRFVSVLQALGTVYRNRNQKEQLVGTLKTKVEVLEWLKNRQPSQYQAEYEQTQAELKQLTGE